MRNTILSFLFLLFAANVFSQDRTTLFDNTKAHYPYRIPAIATTCKSGRLIAVSDYRPCKFDIGFGRVDLKYRYSEDNGMTWSPELLLVQGDGIDGSSTCGYGDAAIVADSEDDNSVMVICVTGNTSYPASNYLEGNPNRIARLYSNDGGKTWGEPVDISEDIYSMFKEGNHPIKGCFVGSGKLFQSRCVKVGSHYRIYAALCARDYGNRMIYSDDFGQTWHPLGGPDALPVPYGDEPKAEEMPDGRVLISSRTRSGRYFNLFTYSNTALGEGQWEADATFSGASNNGVLGSSNACNGEIMVLPATRIADQKDVYVVLQSVPTGTERRNVKIFYKILQSKDDYINSATLSSNWDGSYQVSTTTSAYSTMTLQADGKIGFFLEENERNGGYDMVYLPLTLETITSNRLTLNLSPDLQRK